MAGQPVKRKLVAALEEKARAMTEEMGEPCTVLDVVYEYLATRQGRLSDLALDLAKLAGIQVSERNGGAVLAMWLNRQDGGRAMLEKARADAAHMLVEEAEEIAEQVDEDKQAIAKAKLQIENKQWTASRWNRKAYGQTDATSVNVNLNLGAMHLDALRVRKLEEQQEMAAVEGQDYEIVPALPPAQPGEAA